MKPHTQPVARPTILSVATANPDLYVPQSEAYEFYLQSGCLPENQKPLYKRLLHEGPIRGRYFGLARKEDVLDEDPDSLIERFGTYGRQLSSAAARQALLRAGVQADEVGAIVTNTCTGYLCPGLSSYVAEDVGLPTDSKPMDIMGMGCGAAIPNLEAGWRLLRSGHTRPVLCVATEVCSATHFMGDDPGLTVSNCIFGDGSAAAVLSPAGEGPVALLDFASGLYPRHRNALKYDHEGGRLRNRLGARVPVIGAACIEEVAGRLLARHNLTAADINWWAVHAGGTTVLDEVSRRLSVSRAALASSYGVFETYGNMSSPTVLFVLDDILQHQQAKGYGMLMAFGAGFTAFAALAAGQQ